MSRSRTDSTGAVYGIDLGTTYSCLAGIGASGQAEIIPQMSEAATLPSVVLTEVSCRNFKLSLP